MKKIWIGIGGSVLVIALGSTIAQKMVPDYTPPIRNLTGGLCIMIPLAALIIYMGSAFGVDDIKKAFSKKPKTQKLADIKAATDIENARLAFIIFLLFESILLGAFGFGGVRSIKAIADMVNGPTEKVIVSAVLKEDTHRGHKGVDRTHYYLIGITDDDDCQKITLTVSSVKREEVDAVLKKAKWDYGLDAKYTVRYFENTGNLCELQMIAIE